MTKPTMDAYLRPGQFIDSDHRVVISFAERAAATAPTHRRKALALYYAVRDGIRYDPYRAFFDRASYRASDAVTSGRGWCVAKSALMAAGCRVFGIPARVGYADVKNHIATGRLVRLMRSNVFAWHSYCEVYLDGKWVKATPAFNSSLCARFGMKPMPFDGFNDSLFPEYDESGLQRMEYVRDRGSYSDVPYDEILATFRELYPPEYLAGSGGDFANEVDGANCQKEES